MTQQYTWTRPILSCSAPPTSTSCQCPINWQDWPGAFSPSPSNPRWTYAKDIFSRLWLFFFGYSNLRMTLKMGWKILLMSGGGWDRRIESNQIWMHSSIIRETCPLDQWTNARVDNGRDRARFDFQTTPRYRVEWGGVLGINQESANVVNTTLWWRLVRDCTRCLAHWHCSWFRWFSLYCFRVGFGVLSFHYGSCSLEWWLYNWKHRSHDISYDSLTPLYIYNYTHAMLDFHTRAILDLPDKS